MALIATLKAAYKPMEDTIILKRSCGMVLDIKDMQSHFKIEILTKRIKRPKEFFLSLESITMIADLRPSRSLGINFQSEGPPQRRFSPMFLPTRPLQ